MSKEDVGVVHENILRRLAALEGAEAIRALKARYAELVDRCIDAPSAENAAAVADLFAEDAAVDFAQFGAYKGRAQIAGFFADVITGAAAWTRHYMMNPIIEVNDGSATGRWYCIAQAVFKDKLAAGPQPLWVRYEDTYVKTEQGWKLGSSVVHFDSPPAAG